jgi:GTP-binding protein EngB required for normal cell division
MTDEFLVSKNFDEIKNSSNNIILFGSVGAGKTTLINKLCNVDLLTKEDGFSCTRDVQYSRTPDGNIIIDFPGLNAAEEIVKHLKIQKSTLSSIPARMICLVIKLTARYDDIIKSALQMVKIFYENRNNITIIITNSENITIVQEAEISKSLENKCKINPTHILFTSKKMSAEELRNKLNIIKNDMSNIETIKLKDRDLLNTVGNDGDIDVIEEREAFLKEFKESLEKFKTEYNSSKESALKFALYFAFVDYKEQLIERFSEIVKKKVTDTDTAIVEIITFNNEIFVDFNSFSKQVQTGLKAEFANYDNGDNNNRYKKCPHCNTIWFKVKGCNSMPCGRRTKLKDIFMGRFKNYIVKFIKGKIEVLTNEKTKEMDAGTDSEFVGLTEEEKQFNEGNRGGKSKIYPQGCGASLDWTQMEDVTDEINKKVTEISLDNYDNKVKEKIESVKIDIFQ